VAGCPVFWGRTTFFSLNVCTTMMHYQIKMAGCINPCKWPL
jgi:hypothetical protein